MLFPMFGRTCHILLLIFVSLWFGVIAPGHERGSIKLGGGTSCHLTTTAADEADAAPAGMSCCAMPKDDAATGEGEKEEKPVDPASCCAVCYLNATLSVTPVICLQPMQVDEIDELSPAALVGLASIGFRQTFLQRGPPAFC